MSWIEVSLWGPEIIHVLAGTGSEECCMCSLRHQEFATRNPEGPLTHDWRVPEPKLCCFGNFFYSLARFTRSSQLHHGHPPFPRRGRCRHRRQQCITGASAARAPTRAAPAGAARVGAEHQTPRARMFWTGASSEHPPGGGAGDWDLEYRGCEFLSSFLKNLDQSETSGRWIADEVGKLENTRDVLKLEVGFVTKGSSSVFVPLAWKKYFLQHDENCVSTSVFARHWPKKSL